MTDGTRNPWSQHAGRGVPPLTAPIAGIPINSSPVITTTLPVGGVKGNRERDWQ
ncbi:MAG: hypothetical protein U1A77_10375 [Pirellulales bacterium]